MSDWTKERVRAAEMCTWCPRLCHFVCPTAAGEASEDATAWGMVTLANLVRKDEIPFDADVARRFFLCAGCLRCQRFCGHGNDVPDLMELARERAFASGVAPDAACAIRDAFAAHGAPTEPSGALREALDAIPTAASGVGVWLSCDHRDRFDADRVRDVVRLVGELEGREARLAWGAGNGCCGGSAERAGLPGSAEAATQRFVERCRGFERVVTDCISAAERLETAGVPVETLAVFLERHAAALTDRARGGRPGETLTLHGGCRERRQRDQRASERAVLEAIGFCVVDAWAVRDEQECCGGDRVYRTVSPAGAREAAVRLAARARGEPNSRLATSAERCSHHLTDSCGQPVPSVLDLVVERCGRPS